MDQDPNDPGPDSAITNAKSVYLFGRDVSRIPCFRNTYLYGISGGIGTGLLTFLLTSRTTLATHVAVGTFAGISIVYWVHCRYQFSKTKFEYMRLKAGMQAHIAFEGTNKEKTVRSGEANSSQS